MSRIESTYKARDVEETIDILFYRPTGYVLARASQAVGITPNEVTIVSIIVGITAGHLFYYTDLMTNVLGMILLVIAEAMDSADGQLARMTSSHSRFGRILDGFGGNLMFISVYLHLCLRIISGGGSAWVVPVAILAGASHSFQCAMADYYRNAYLYFVYGESRSELDEASTVAGVYGQLRWRKDFIRKPLMKIYLNYTRQQELLAKNFRELYTTAQQRFGANLPDWLKREYAEKNKPLLKYYNFITTNTRVIALFCALAIGHVLLYLAFELLVLNAVLVGVTVRQEKLNRRMLMTVLERLKIRT